MFKSSIVQYGQNGRDKRYGSNTYRGNTDGNIVHDFLDFCEMKFKRPVQTCSDYMVGSGTTKDVCVERGVDGVWTDLRYGFNLLKEDCEIPDRPEAIFWHPPYSSMIGIPYAGAEWSDKEFISKFGYDPKPYDLGRMDWDKFVKALNYCVMKMYSALEKGGRMGILMGDIRRKGVKYVLRDIPQYGLQEGYCIIGLEDINSGWIPCTVVDHPEHCNDCEVTFNDVRGYGRDIAFYTDKWRRTSDEAPILVVAWKEPSAPYQPKGE